MTSTRPDRLVAITANLSYRREQSEELASARETATMTAELRPLLRGFHDDLMATLEPRLAVLKSEGAIVNLATSWQLGEFVAHSPWTRVDEVIGRLAAFPELKDVARGEPLHGPGKRRR